MIFSLRARSSENCKQSKMMPTNSLQKIKQSLPTSSLKANFQLRHNRYIYQEQNKQQNKAAFVKNVIDNYFQQEEQFQKKMVFLGHSKNRNFGENRVIRRSKIFNQLIPLQSTSNVIHNNTKAEAIFPSFQQKDKQKQTYRLPPIHELTQDAEQQQNLNQSVTPGNSTSLSFYFRSTSAFSEYLNPEAQLKETKVKSYQNEIFTIYVLLENGHPIARLKQFKPAGQPVLARELKMLNYDVPQIWHQSKINSFTFETGMQLPLKDMLYKMKPDELNPALIRIYPKPLSKKLRANQCQELKILLKTFCQDLSKLKGKVINNKVNSANLFLTKQYKLCLAEWGHSSFRQTYNIGPNMFETRQKGVIQGQHSWLVSPQYLAPQIINQILGQQSQGIWDSNSSPDIWSLGLTIFQILTLIPVWSVNKCFVVGKPNIIRAGVLNVPGRDLNKLHYKQMSIQKNVKKCLQIQLQGGETEITNLIVRMLDPDPFIRISWEQILRQL